MRSLLLVSLPALAAGHGVRLPATKSFDEAREAGLWSQQQIAKVVDECSGHLQLCAAANDWDMGASCLIKGYENIQDEACRAKIAAAAQHYPAAKFAAMTDHEARAHLTAPRDENATNYGCKAGTDPNPYIWSYHIHIQWDEDGKDSMQQFSDGFREMFMGGKDTRKPCRQMAFLEDLWNFDSIPAEDIDHHMYAETCQQFAEDEEFWPFPPGGPFYHNNTGFTISPTTFHQVLPWVAANRPLDDKLWIFIHPNTGCQFNDLKHYSMWAGESTDMFYQLMGEFNGCLWAACNDETMGCISFNHDDETQGYGQCFTPPTAETLNIPAVMTLLPGSNSTDMQWPQSSLVV